MVRNGSILGGLGEGINEHIHTSELRFFHETIFASDGNGIVFAGLKWRGVLSVSKMVVK
jgi:hypothetical protein